MVTDLFLLRMTNWYYKNNMKHTKQYEIYTLEIQSQIYETFEKDVIKLSNSPWKSPLVIVPKKIVYL